MLTIDPIEPVSIRSIEAVRPRNYQFALNPREFVTANDKSANHLIARMLLTTTIDSPLRARRSISISLTPARFSHGSSTAKN